MTDPIYCSEVSRDLGEPAAGVGAHPKKNLLISWPIGKWTENLRRAKDMTEEELDWVESTVGNGWRINLMDRPRRKTGEHLIYQFPQCLAYRVPRPELTAFLKAFNERGEEGVQAWLTGMTPDRVMLCCTHGRKDKCCARFGNAAYMALQRTQQETGLPVEVWRCTHLGGCRLSGSAIVFPQRHKYGRLTPDCAADLLAAASEGRPWVSGFRGSSDLQPAEQCAEVAALQWLEDRGINASLTVCQQQTAHSGVSVGIEWDGGVDAGRGYLTVQCQSVAITRYSTCADIPTGPSAAQYWKPVSVVASAEQDTAPL